MNGAAFLLGAALVATSAAAEAPVQRGAEVYVAELDGDWNVAREVRLRCDALQGCAAELDGALKIHVRFDALGGGAVAVSSSVEDAAGRTTQEPEVTLALDGRGFGAAHVETASADGKPRILMMAMQAPDLAPAEPRPPSATTRKPAPGERI